MNGKKSPKMEPYELRLRFWLECNTTSGLTYGVGIPESPAPEGAPSGTGSMGYEFITQDSDTFLNRVVELSRPPTTHFDTVRISVTDIDPLGYASKTVRGQTVSEFAATLSKHCECNVEIGTCDGFGSKFQPETIITKGKGSGAKPKYPTGGMV